MPRAFLDIAIGDIEQHETQLRAYNAAEAFCKKFAAMYGLPEELKHLNDEQSEILADAYDARPECAINGPLQFTDPGPVCAGRITVELFEKAAPKAVANFLSLCTGEKGIGKTSKKPLHYKGVPFHRAVKGFCCQGGDVVKRDGSGGESIYGATFKDEKAALKLSHARPGTLSMANSGKHSNSSQFFFTLAPAPQCDGKHVVLGEVVEGLSVLSRIDAEAGTADGNPRTPVTILDCGAL